MKLIKILLTLILITGINFSASGQSYKGDREGAKETEREGGEWSCKSEPRRALDGVS